MEKQIVITEGTGNLLLADVDALVNTVNTVGVMGKGIALQFRRAYPDMFRDYARAAKAGEIRLGHVQVWPTGLLDGPKYVINFPTKGHWRSRSKLSDINDGLVDLVRIVNDLEIASIAVPPLGCGNGGLRWSEVEPCIRAAFEALPEVDVRLFAPGDAPHAAVMPERRSPVTMTLGRAALIRVLRRYQSVALESSLIEVQKLMYFLQVAGQPLRLRFEKGHYGPYADNLRAVLREMEGSCIEGFGDGSAKVMEAEPITILAGADEAAASLLARDPATEARIDRVMALVDGFESMYGMELLSSVHWLMTESPESADSVDEITVAVQCWNPRKGRLFTADHISVAWQALRDRGWMPVGSP
ncbi:MAG: macro domain-containing protein [Candidatus Nanopelagicales bacterium]|nr:macro domain-containing protein [Candidatus Nanopelagicales bacterium]